MNILEWDKKIWQSLLYGEMAIAAVTYLYEVIVGYKASIFNIIILAVITITNILQDKNKYLHYFAIWFNIIILPQGFCIVWNELGNRLLYSFPKLSVVWILIMWCFWLVLLLPIVMTSAKYINNWLLRLIAFFFLDSQYGMDTGLHIQNLPIMHSINNQGVVSAFALLIIACFLSYAWGLRFNPNLRFIRSKNFKWSVGITLIILLAVDIWWNVFGITSNNLLADLFGFDISWPFHFTWPNFTSALEPGVLEESERYVWMIILLMGFKNNRKWRLPIAIYGSTILFASTHLNNIGVHGQSVMATWSQVIAVTDVMAWAAAYFYFGKLWLLMIVHFLSDYLINIQYGWSSPETWSGTFGDYATTIIPLVFGLIVTIWMLTGKKRRQVMEENADRLLNQTSKPELPTFIEE